MSTHNEQAQRMRRHLQQLCSDAGCALVQGRGWGSRFVALSTAIGMSAALGACYGGPMPPPAESPAPPPPPPESAEMADAILEPAPLAVAKDEATDRAAPAPAADEVASLGAESIDDTH